MYANVAFSDKNAVIEFNTREIFFEVTQGKLPKEADPSFAIWALLPLAMTSGANLHIDAEIDPTVIENAQALSRVWEMWTPGRFSAVNITSSGSRNYSNKGNLEELQLFSGGVDSTYALLLEKKRHFLTIQGLDFQHSDNKRFIELLNKTDSLIKSVNGERIILRTNIYDYVRSADINHGFALAACLFLFQDTFSNGVIAADYTWAQDMVAFHWGTNHVTNQYFAGSQFKMHTVSADKTRIEKLGYIANNPTACRSLSFCTDKKSRPDNCGVCSKCVRTKAMFLAATGVLPPIFNVYELTGQQIRKIDLNNRKEYAFFADIYAVARDQDRLFLIPDLELHLRRHRMKIKNTIYRQKILKRIRKAFYVR